MRWGVLSFLIGAALFAVEVEEPEFTIRVPILDYPFVSSNGFSFPSMDQSLALSNDFYQGLHHGIYWAYSGKDTFLSRLTVLGADILSTYLPLGGGWLHEEWHRAVMTKHQVSSFNDVYHFPLFAGSIAVSHVTDADLARLKQESPADFVRLAEAGMEANYEQVFDLEKESFFYGATPWNFALYWQAYAGNIAYLFTCASKGRADNFTDNQNAEDGANVERRDFTGLDCTAWVYDLHRPSEAYSARGAHPSGVGTNRYRRYSDLSSDERDYLALQSYLSLLNLLDPNLIGFTSFGNESRWNLSLRHHLTSFGYTIDVNLFWRRENLNLLVISHLYANGEKYFPGLDVQLLKYPFRWMSQDLFLSPRIMLWLQPKGQLFRTPESLFGGLFGTRVGRTVSENVEIYSDLEWKSEGWVAGRVYLEPNFSVRLGVSYLFF